MEHERLRFSAVCTKCGDHRRFTYEEILAALRARGFMRREGKPTIEMISTLLSSHDGGQSALPCEACDSRFVGWETRTLDDDFEGEWNDVRLCEGCKQPLDPERLEIFPDTVLCPACQRREEKGELDGEVVYCRHCGDKLVMKREERGLARYRQYCPSCRRWE